MKRFKFPLETWLNVQNQRLKILKKDLFSLEENKSLVAKNLKEIKEEISTIKKKNHLKKGDFFESRRLQENLKITQKKLENVVELQKNKKKEARAALQMRKVVAKMKESRYLIWYEKLKDEE